MSYPRESQELVPVTITVNGVEQTVANASNIEVCVVDDTYPLTRPSAWVAIDTLATDLGVMIGPTTQNDFSADPPTDHGIWARVVSNPEIPIIYLGTFRTS